MTGNTDVCLVARTLSLACISCGVSFVTVVAGLAEEYYPYQNLESCETGRGGGEEEGGGGGRGERDEEGRKEER